MSHAPATAEVARPRRSRGRFAAAIVGFSLVGVGVAQLLGSQSTGAGSSQIAAAEPHAEDDVVQGAVAKADHETYEAMLDASETGEARENITLRQAEIDGPLRQRLRVIFNAGDGVFEHEFSTLDGYGAGPYPGLSRVHRGLRGGLDTYSCAGCHSVGGPDGAGAETQNAFLNGDGDRASSAVVRNPPMVLGLGFVQSLGVEMSLELQRLRDGAVSRANESGAPVAVSLVAKGVSFGEIVAHPGGEVDTSRVRGVRADLVVRPFGWKGSQSLLRRFAEDAARIHFGIQSHVLCLSHKDAPDASHLGGDGPWFDPDRDGVQFEIEEGAVTASAVYLAMLESPIIEAPAGAALHARWTGGSATFDEIGCASCHARSLHLDSPHWAEHPDTTKAAPVFLDLLEDGETPRSTLDVALFSDLALHDMGAELADAYDDLEGTPRATFLTRPLWGLADTAPYLHDGRAATIPEAILAHGGEARPARDAFAALDEEERANLHVFLLSLTRSLEPRVPL